MPWIESHTILVRHPKVKDLARRLRIKPVYVIGHLHVLWHNVLELREDGDLAGLPVEEIADLAHFSGNAPQFVQHLRESKWLDGNLLHDWLDYAGRYLISKYKTSNHDKLVEIWAKYGKTYFRPPKDSPPNITLPNITLPKDVVVTRTSAVSEKQLSGKDFILRCDDGEFKLFLSQVHQLINRENIGRAVKFNWGERFESDMKVLIYKLSDDDKVKILTTDGVCLTHGVVNWCNYVLTAIKYTIRASRKTKINSPLAFTINMLQSPNKLYSESVDGILK